MKKNYIKLILFVLFILLFIIFNIFISNKFILNNTYYLLFWFITFLLFLFSFGFPKDKHLYKIDIIQIVFIYSTIYFIIIYIFGFFFGFVKSPYNLSFLKIIFNIIPAFLIIMLQEFIRFIYISKSKEKKIILYLLTITFILYDIAIGINHYQIKNAMDLFEIIGLLILPSIIKHLFLTFLTYKGGYKVSIFYRLLFEVTTYILPFFPDLGTYLNSVLNIIFPVLLFLKLNSFLAQNKHVTKRKKKIFFLLRIVTSACLFIMIILISGIFKVYSLAIASNSMQPVISKGDVIIVQKLNYSELTNLKIGNIIAYFYDGRVIVHRIIAINIKNNEYTFQTKGDNNSDADDYTINSSQIRGIVYLKISYIGYPSVWISELTH